MGRYWVIEHKQAMTTDGPWSLEFELPEGVTVDPSPPEFGPIAPRQTAAAEVEFRVFDPQPGRLTIPFRVVYLEEGAAEPIRCRAGRPGSRQSVRVQSTESTRLGLLEVDAMDESPSLHVPSERESVIEAARAMEGKSPRERMAMFIDLLETVDVVWRKLTPEERRRRIEIARRLDPAPNRLNCSRRSSLCSTKSSAALWSCRWKTATSKSPRRKT